MVTKALHKLVSEYKAPARHPASCSMFLLFAAPPLTVWIWRALASAPQTPRWSYTIWTAPGFPRAVLFRPEHCTQIFCLPTANTFRHHWRALSNLPKQNAILLNQRPQFSVASSVHTSLWHGG